MNTQHGRTTESRTAPSLSSKLRSLAERYETADFISGDPSWFMHQVSGRRNQEATAFLAQSISYGSRKQFMPKIQWMLDRADGDVDGWVRSGKFLSHLPDDPGQCFYRLYCCREMRTFLSAYRQLMAGHGSLGEYVDMAISRATSTDEHIRQTTAGGVVAVKAVCLWFASHGATCVVPKDAASACKRLCMFLRWMVRTSSPVDLGLWSDVLSRRALIMPLDTHVLQQSVALGLLASRTASMNAALKLTAAVAEIFPDDPLKADFALFGYGVTGGETIAEP